MSPSSSVPKFTKSTKITSFFSKRRGPKKRKNKGKGGRPKKFHVQGNIITVSLKTNVITLSPSLSATSPPEGFLSASSASWDSSTSQESDEGGASKKTVQHNHSLPKDQQHHFITFFIYNISPQRFFFCIFPILGSATMLQTINQKETDTHPVEHT